MTDITINLQSFLTSFGATTLETAKDEGLMSLDVCKNKILEILKQNIENYKSNNWNNKNQMMKLITDSERLHKSIFSLRIGGKKVYRCSCELLDLAQKLEFLLKFYEMVEQNNFNQEIARFCEEQVNAQKMRKEKSKARKKAKQQAEKIQSLNKTLDAAQPLLNISPELLTQIAKLTNL